MIQNQEKKSVQTFIAEIAKKDQAIECTGLTPPASAYMVAQCHKEWHLHPIVVVVPSVRDAERFSADLRFFLSEDPDETRSDVTYLPHYNTFPFKFLSYHNETAAKRIGILYQMATESQPRLVVTTPEVFLQRLPPRETLCNYAELIIAGEDMDRDMLIHKLIAGGYAHTLIVEEPGDFCVRGGILDIFPPMYANPLRIEFFGDTAESLRGFSAATQRTLYPLSEAVILPAREVILEKALLPEITERISDFAFQQNLRVSYIRELTERISKQEMFPGIENLLPLIYPETDTLSDYLPDTTCFVLTEPSELAATASAFQDQVFKNYHMAKNEGKLCVDPDTLTLKWHQVREQVMQSHPLIFKSVSVQDSEASERETALHHFFVKENMALREALIRDHLHKTHLFAPLKDWITEKQQQQCITLLIAGTVSQAERLTSLLAPYGIQPTLIQRFSHIHRGKGAVYLCIGNISAGFVWERESLAILTDTEIFGKRQRKQRRVKSKIQTELLDFNLLKAGELVVHKTHGIGQYQGLVKLSVNDIANDFLLILYQDDDKLYLPADRMNMIQKYMGIEGVTPSLDKMGGKSWEKVKQKVQKSAEKIAGELLKLYAERRVRKGFAYADQTQDLKAFESGFPYEETPDQIQAIEDVLNDMAADTPMDRLICGDVGYGKTEVALRASFVAVNNGKQVAVLVPTTVLAEQHFATFSERFEDFPIHVAALSRFRSAKAQQEIRNRLKQGQIDIIIGTHRLLQKDVIFKDLGLVIIDEEQRFGVRHKERLKGLRSTVDVLALTATPIPRTLHISLMGIRDISVISTPPEERRPIRTYICEFDDAIIADAIRRELNRKGQLFFVHNHIHNIDAMADRLQRLVPELKLGVAHSRLSETALEEIMMGFINKEMDMLVCTTIIEAGLDIASANTILINRADKFGLSQIYQLRGRVGRSEAQAYAYLFIPNETLLTKDAQKRLKVLMEYSDLGSGFQIAMSDLRIRGGGTILGASQSGHIAAVGYEMFLELMEKAMADVKGEPVQEALEPEINIPISAFLPESYIPDTDQRFSAYRRLAKMTDLKEIAAFKAELTDRFGALPSEAGNLLLRIMLRILCVKAGIRRLDMGEDQVLLSFSEIHQKNPAGITEMVMANPDRFCFASENTLRVKLMKGRGYHSPMLQIKTVLKEILQ